MREIYWIVIGVLTIGIIILLFSNPLFKCDAVYVSGERTITKYVEIPKIEYVYINRTIYLERDCVEQIKEQLEKAEQDKQTLKEMLR